MGLIGIGAVLALLLVFLTLRAKARRDRVVRLIRETSVTSIADLVQSFAARTDPASPTHAAVQGCVVARETTRLTAPITGSSCVAYEVSVYETGDEDETSIDYIEDSKWVPWAVDDGTGLALAPFDPVDRPEPHKLALMRSEPKGFRYRSPLGYLPSWPGIQSSGATFKNTPQQLDRVVSHYGYAWLPGRDLPYHVEKDSGGLSILESFGGLDEQKIQRWLGDNESLAWEVRILKEFGNEVYLLGPYTIQEGCAHFQLGSDSLLWLGSRADALSHEQLSARSSARWAVIWFTVFVILSVVMLFSSSAV